MINQKIASSWKIFLSLYTLSLCSFQLINSAAVSTSPHLDDHWEKFKANFNKTYHPRLEKNKRLEWEKNFRLIQKHNEEHERGLHTYELEANHLADLSQREYLRELVKLTQSKRKPRSREITALPHHNLTAIPGEVGLRVLLQLFDCFLDWRKEGFITEPENQEECGSCYAFAVVGCLQGQYFKTRKKIVNFSTQQLVDCSITAGNLGCAGGSLRNALKYIQSVGGLMFEDDYPYIAKQSVCNYTRNRAAVRIKSWAILPPKDENALKIALATIGPISVSINASPSTFQLYAKGVYNDPACSPEYVNHAMLLVGYTRSSWILKNWWTDEWGEDGYMRLARGHNRCAIANYAAHATIL